MQNKILWGLFPAILALGFVLGGCPILDDDDDSAMDDDDSAMDDDDVMDDDDSAMDDDDSAADDDDDLPLALVSIDISCEDLVRDENTDWTVTVTTEGWIAYNEGEEDWALKLFMWDGNTWEDHHWIDSWQPFYWFTNELWGSDATECAALGVAADQCDQWQINFTGWDDIAEADATGETILKCYDSNGVPQFENRDYMVCANDFADETIEHCWYCGDYFGEPAGTTADPVGTVGSFDGDAGMWTATDQSANCVYAGTNP
jgi:hypothetical protein